MINLRFFVPILGLVAAIPAVSNAQWIPLCETTYSIQVQYEHWTSGSQFWSTKFTTDNLAEAELMLALFESAQESGDLEDILNTSWSYIIVDVRLVSKTTCRYIEMQNLIYEPHWWMKDYPLKTR